MEVKDFQSTKMLPCKSESFTFRRTSLANSSGSSRSSGNQNCRKNLRAKFEQVDVEKEENAELQNNDKSILSMLSLNDNTKRVLKNGAEKITKSLNSVRTTFGTISQMFKISTKRRQILEEGPVTPNGGPTPHGVSKALLGRTPTRLYSPFGIESPYNKPTTYNKENLTPSSQVVLKR